MNDDGDYDYYWSDVRIPRWLGELLDVPFMIRLELVLIGVCVGLIMAAFAMLIGFWSA